jgi:methylmalonyl-CoA/ethylmalonyl-CoA epimerase
VSLIVDPVPHHFCISTSDLDASLIWWREIFGFELDFRFELPHIRCQGAFVRRGAFRIELFHIAGSAPTPPERLRPDSDLMRQGGKHICFSVEDPQAALETLHEKGVTIAGVRRPGGPMREEADPRLDAEPGRSAAMAVFLLDPAGALVELVRRADFPD